MKDSNAEVNPNLELVLIRPMRDWLESFLSVADRSGNVYVEILDCLYHTFIKFDTSNKKILNVQI